MLETESPVGGVTLVFDGLGYVSCSLCDILYFEANHLVHCFIIKSEEMFLECCNVIPKLRKRYNRTNLNFKVRLA